MPIANEKARPRWSVMIPTYNCAGYLRTTLENCVSQHEDDATMEIVVVDDVSSDDPEGVVAQVAGSHATFFRQPKNLGAVGNFNACLSMARGEWVHLLHGDDYVSRNFYAEMQDAAERFPEAGALLAHVVVVDENNVELHHKPRWAENPQILDGFGRKQACENRVQFAAMVVRRDIYERIGGFHPDLIHCADWEMWTRVALATPVVYVPDAIGYYRVHSAADTAKLVVDARDFEDRVRAAKLIVSHFPADQRPEVARGIRRFICCFGLASIARLLRKGKLAGAWRQLRWLLRTEKRPWTLASCLAEVAVRGLERVREVRRTAKARKQ